jgi:hypothetical protein
MDGATTEGMRTDIVPAAYPGSAAGPMEVMEHAERYRAGAMILLGPGAEKSLQAPARLCAIHAIELYLNAYLLHRGEIPSTIRAMQHDMAARSTLAQKHGLVFRKKTAEHLIGLGSRREYTAVRYAPDQATGFSEINRLTATLDQVRGKVRMELSPPCEQAAVA